MRAAHCDAVEMGAQQAITKFLGAQPSESVTAPLGAYGSPVTIPSTTVAPVTPSTSGSEGQATTTTTSVPGTGPFNPTVC